MKTLGLLIAIVFSQLFFGCTNTESIQSNDENFGLEGIELRIEDSLNYQEIGFDYAMKTKGALGKVLMGAIKNKGTVHAVERCNISAMPMIDAVASSNNVSIKRVTDKPRNPVNQANEMELDYITISKEVLAKGRKVEPKVQEFDEKVLCFYPIMTNQMCMQCHGNPVTDIQSETLTKIDELYPNDMARGYSSDQLRGVWVVEMDKK